jgi:protein-tyrosine phosphatase
MRVAARHGLSLEGHEAQRLTRELLHGSCRVLVMSTSHLGAVGSAMLGTDAALITDLLPESDSRRGQDVPDPFGQEDDAYERAFDTLQSAVAALFERLERVDGHDVGPI